MKIWIFILGNPAERLDYNKFYFLRRLLFEKKQHFGDCGVVGRFRKNTILHKPPCIAVNNHQEEKLMSKNDYIIRLERKEEYRAVENLVRESFWNVYRPGCLEHYVLNQLREDEAFVSQLDFVMEKDGQLIGQTMFMYATIKADDGRDIPIMTMGPICIMPELKRQGYGKKLLDYSLKKAAEYGCGALCFEGNINFYGKWSRR